LIPKSVKMEKVQDTRRHHCLNPLAAPSDIEKALRRRLRRCQHPSPANRRPVARRSIAKRNSSSKPWTGCSACCSKIPERPGSPAWQLDSAHHPRRIATRQSPPHQRIPFAQALIKESAIITSQIRISPAANACSSSVGPITSGKSHSNRPEPNAKPVARKAHNTGETHSLRPDMVFTKACNLAPRRQGRWCRICSQVTAQQMFRWECKASAWQASRLARRSAGSGTGGPTPRQIPLLRAHPEVVRFNRISAELQKVTGPQASGLTPAQAHLMANSVPAKRGSDWPGLYPAQLSDSPTPQCQADQCSNGLEQYHCQLASLGTARSQAHADRCRAAERNSRVSTLIVHEMTPAAGNRDCHSLAKA